jgi:hypothetical protein
MSDLGNAVSLEHGVPGCFMGQIRRHEADKSLNFMHHSIHVGHLQPVFDSRDAAWPNDPVDFFMKFLCQDTNKISLKG